MDVVLALESMMVSVLVPLVPIVDGLKLLATVGAVTVKVAVAAVPLPALVVVTAPVLLRWLPATAEVTATVTVQLPLAGIVPPLSASELPLADPVAVPPQVLVSAGVAVLVTLAG